MADFLGGLMARRMALLAVMTISQSAGLAVIAVAVVVAGEPAPGAGFVPYAMLAGAAGACGLAAFYRGLAVGKMSVVAPISSMAVVVPVAVGLVTGDRPSALQSAGALIGLVGIVLASREGADEASDELAAAAAGGRRDARLAAGVGLALIAGLGFGSFFVAMDVAADYDPLWANLVNRGTSLSLGVLAVVAFRPSFRGVGRRDLPVLVALGLLEMGANVGFAYAATKGLLSLTSILSSLYPVVVVFLSWLILHERLHRTQRLGVAAALLGASLIAAG